MGFNDTPRANRLHIGIYGKRNSGKSSLVNALTGQDIALVSAEAGTTTDPVFKSMELHPIGPVVFIDTAGFDDEGELGQLRVKRTQEVLNKTDLAVLVIDGTELASAVKSEEAGKEEAETGRNPVNTINYKSGECAPAHSESNLKQKALIGFADEKRWLKALEEKSIPVIIAINKLDAFMENAMGENFSGWLAAQKHTGGHSAAWQPLAEILDLAGAYPVIAVSATQKKGLDNLRKAIEQAVPEDFLREKILGDLVMPGSLVMLVMPQDIQAPKGRLILPQVQTLRELLDQKCTTVATTADGFERALAFLQEKPELIITDSQCFNMVYQKKPKESALTSFSVLFAAYKGDMGAFLKGALSLDDMDEKSRILIAEACTHVPLSEDIGREKIPKLLHKKFGEGLEIVNVCGNDFPELAELKRFDLVIHCGACMFNRKHVLNRIAAAEAAGVPITNYGIVLAKLAGILDKVRLPQQADKHVDFCNKPHGEAAGAYEA